MKNQGKKMRTQGKKIARGKKLALGERRWPGEII
jgi:hypothetical protein